MIKLSKETGLAVDLGQEISKKGCFHFKKTVNVSKYIFKKRHIGM